MSTLQELLNNTNYLDKIDAPELSDFKSADELRDYLQERIQEYDVIYYSNAMDYLREKDTSLMESLELAADFGYEVAALNSEILATLHIQQAMTEEMSRLDLESLF